MRIQAFSALRPTADLVHRVASLPYDVVDTDEARALVEREPLSFLRVVRSEVDLPDDTDPAADAVYQRAAERLSELQASGVMVREQVPTIYLYRQEMTLAGRRLSQTGVVACCHVEDYQSDRIKKHELTRKAKEDDRTRHVLTLGANTGPVFLLHQDEAPLDALVQQDCRADPLYDFEAEDGVRHTVWRAADPTPYVEGFAAVQTTYVADGHHRSASASRAAMSRAAANPEHLGHEEYNWFLAVMFPASALTILPYHRLVDGLGAHDVQGLLRALAGVVEVSETSEAAPEQPGTIGMYLAGRWYRLRFSSELLASKRGAASLDCALLSEVVLGPLLGIQDLRTDPRMSFVGGIRGTEELERRVGTSTAKVAFAMHPTTVEQLRGVADAGEIMPPKSTWFEPKLRSGMLVHTLD